MLLKNLVVFGCMLAVARAQTMPTGCAYSEGLYTCNYDTLNTNSLIPLDATGFNPIPQRLRLTNLPATLSSAIFNANFASLSTSNYDTNYPATLELECYPDTTLTLSAGWLANMGHIQEFKVINCQLGTVPASAFSELGEVDRFFIENGTITSMNAGMLTGVTAVRNSSASLAFPNIYYSTIDIFMVGTRGVTNELGEVDRFFIENGTITSMNAGMLTGVTAVRNSSASPAFPKHWGEIKFLNTKITGGTFDPAVIASQSGLYSLVLRNLGLTSIDASLLDGCTSIRYLDLSYNDFTSLPAGLFTNLTSLGEILMYGIDIDGCTCGNLWFLDYAYQNMISFHGDVICTNTSGWENKLAWHYYHENCITYGDDCKDGISLAGSCLTAIDLSGYCIGGVAFILGWVVLGLSIHTLKVLDGGGSSGKGKGKPGAKKKAPAKKNSGWA